MYGRQEFHKMNNNNSPASERRYKRCPISSYIDLFYVHKRYLGRTIEISQGGILVMSDYAFEPRSRLSVYFNIKDQVFQARAEVLYTIQHPIKKKQYMIGLLFLDRSYHKNDIIQKFVAEVLK